MTALDLFADAPAAAAPLSLVPTREEGLKRLRDFLPRAGATYAARRNHDEGPGRRNVSVLSPWIRHRLVTEEEVVAAVLSRHSFDAAEKFVQEVFWRTYWKGHLEMRHALWGAARDRAAALLADASPDLATRLTAAEEGRTGIDCFDAWARELADTGFLHNHARMWFASIWIFTLHLPWELGADLFLRKLADADAASNTLSWRWVAGLHTKGKHYVARADNISKYTGGRFSPRGLVSAPEPLVEANPVEASPIRTPIAPVPGLASILLVTEDDLRCEELDLPWPSIRRVVAFCAPDARSSAPVGGPARRFTVESVRTAAERLAQARGLPSTVIEPGDAAALVSALSEEEQVVTSFLPVGWTADALAPVRQALAAQGVPVSEVLRPWDARAWPHARRGFFAFKEHLPALCRAIG
jgi:deoxyribodipyrimidine photo-lyase